MPQRRPKPGIRAIERRLLILCEGAKDKSESAYFKALIKDRRNPNNRIEVKVIDTKKNTARELVQEAKKCREFEGDEVWVVFDKDGYTMHAMAFDCAEANNIKIAFSSICFEYWILLHYEYTTRAFSCCDELVHYMKKHHSVSYEKSDRETYSKTKHLLSVAKKNANKCREYQINVNAANTQVYNTNPYTNIDELVEAIEAFSAE